MRLVVMALMAAGLTACAHGTAASGTVLDMHQGQDWQYEPGETLAATMANDVSGIAKREGREGILSQLKEAGYECTYGEAHEDYPEPAAVCTRSFATRACQMDWEVMLTSAPEKPGQVSAAEAGFTRDCVGTDRDWPVAVKSAIDDQLAPPPEFSKSSLEFTPPDLHQGPIF